MHYSYTRMHCESLPYVPMDISGLSSILNQTSLPLGKEKEKFNFHNKPGCTVIQNHLLNLYRVQLPSTGGVTAGTANDERMENCI